MKINYWDKEKRKFVDVFIKGRQEKPFLDLIKKMEDELKIS